MKISIGTNQLIVLKNKIKIKTAILIRIAIINFIVLSRRGSEQNMALRIRLIERINKFL